MESFGTIAELSKNAKKSLKLPLKKYFILVMRCQRSD